MRLDDFDFTLPDDLIAQFPLDNRTDSRLLCLNRQTSDITHHHFPHILNLLTQNDLLIFNNTKVVPARWFGVKSSGGRVEVLLERLLENQCFLAHIKASKSPKLGTRLTLDGNVLVEVLDKQNGLYKLKCFDARSIFDLLEVFGHVPLPPYMERTDTVFDKDRYQTVYAKHKGAVAAPTAGLHFDERLIQKIQAQGVQIAYLTLHVGAGTFQPVREAYIENHQMHGEYLEVSQTLCEQVKATKAKGGRVVAVGTTSVRSLETAAQSGEIQPFCGESKLFIYPGYEFKCVDAMITNFHLPKSSLIMLLSAFAGRERILRTYQTAIRENYRFYSYGDAMWVAD